MRKELEYEQQLKLMDEKSRVEAEKHHQKMLEKHRVSINDDKVKIGVGWGFKMALVLEYV